MKTSLQKIKVLLASRPKMLSDVIRNMVARQPDMEVIGEVLDPIELLRTAKTRPVDVVIVTPLDSEGEPSICNQLLAEHPQLKIVTLSAKSDNTAFLYKAGSSKQCIEEPSERSILGAIRAAMNRVPG